MELLEWLSLESANVSSHTNSETLLFLLYILVSALAKKSRYLLAFFLFMIIFTRSIFDPLQEYQIYLTSFAVYSYLLTTSKSLKLKVSCGIMCALDLTLAVDAFFYGDSGTHGELKTAIYKNIEYLAFVAHIIIIASLVPFGKIYNCLCSLLDHVFGGSASGYNMSFFWYTIRKT